MRTVDSGFSFKRQASSCKFSGLKAWSLELVARSIVLICLLSTVDCLFPHVSYAASLPSLFRGIVVADSSAGVRIVSVEEGSQAFLADVRAEDILLRVDDADLHRIDEFAALSLALKGRAVRAQLVILRNGRPRDVELHLYSYPLLRRWNIRFVPDYDFRFVEPAAGRDYWARLGRGFEIARNPEQALEAYGNALQNMPDDVALALKVSELLAEAAHARLERKALASALEALDNHTRLLERLFDEPLTEEQVRVVKSRLQQVLQELRAYRMTTEGLKSRQASRIYTVRSG